MCIIRILYCRWRNQLMSHSEDKRHIISRSLVLRIVLFCVYRVIIAMYVHLSLRYFPHMGHLSLSPMPRLLFSLCAYLIIFVVRSEEHTSELQSQ